MEVLQREEGITAAISRLVEGIAKETSGEICLVGIRRRGDEVAERVAAGLKEQGRSIQMGVVDISLYRDDLQHLHRNPILKGSEIDFELEGAHIILVDDVLFTGRTIRAALDALSDYGRPCKVELAVLVDRGGRELPIAPQYVGLTIEPESSARVDVSLAKTDGKDEISVGKE